MLAPCIVTREFMNQVKERGVDDAHIIFINRLDMIMLRFIFFRLLQYCGPFCFII